MILLRIHSFESEETTIANLHVFVAERVQLQLLHHDSLVGPVKPVRELSDSRLEHARWSIAPLGSLNELSLGHAAAELIRLLIRLVLPHVDRRCSCHTWLVTVEETYFLHIFLHLLHFSVDAALSKLDLRDLLVHFILFLFADLVTIAQLGQIFNKFLVLISATLDMILCLLQILRAVLLQLSDLFLHVLEMLVKLVDHLWVFLLLGEDLLRLLLDMRLVNMHQSLDLVSIILLLHRVLDVLHEVLNRVLVPLGHSSGPFHLLFKSVTCILLVLHILIHLLEALSLHVEQLFQVMQVLL